VGTSENVQIRNVDDATYEVLCRRATEQDLSLAQYLRAAKRWTRPSRTCAPRADEVLHGMNDYVVDASALVELFVGSDPDGELRNASSHR